MADRLGPQAELTGGALPSPRLGDIIGGKYRVDGTLGAGGMGVVYSARHVTLDQAVAIKFLVVQDEHYRTEASARLLREAKAVAALRGEHVVRVFDVGETTDGLPFIVMERLEGFDLGRLTDQGVRLPASAACNLLLQACRAVDEAHRLGIVHRDLKPSNLFAVRRSDGQALIKVLDFGISKSLHPMAEAPITLTQEKMALGSPHYMSPEQVRDARSVDARTDVWSLGAVLYELVAGCTVFQASSYPGLFAAIVSDTPRSLSQLRPEVSPELAALVARCLERDANKRVASVAELMTELTTLAVKEVSFDDLAERARPSQNLLQRGLTSSGTLPTQVSVAPPDGEVILREPEPDTSTQRSAAAPLSSPKASPRPASRSSQQEGLPSKPSVSVLGSPASEPRAPQSVPLTQRSGAAASAPTNKRRLLWIVAPALAASSWFGLRQISKPATEAPKPVVSATQSNWLTFESNPPGATVLEGGSVLGTTPFRLDLPKGTNVPTRTFVLELSGYRPYVVEHTPKGENMLVHAELVRDQPAPAPASAGTVVVEAKPAAPPRFTPAPGRRPAPSASASAVVPPEIRFTR